MWEGKDEGGGGGASIHQWPEKKTVAKVLINIYNMWYSCHTLKPADRLNVFSLNLITAAPTGRTNLFFNYGQRGGAKNKYKNSNLTYTPFKLEIISEN